MDKAFSDIYRTEDENTFVDQLKDGVVVLVALVVGVVGMVGAMSVFAAFGGPLSQVLSLVALVVGLTLAFLPMYKFFPDAELGWTDALPGAALAAGGWMLLQYLFQLYVGVSGSGGSSGAIGAVLLLLLWLYLSALVLLLAAVVNAVLLGEFKDDVGASAESDGDGDDETTALRGRLHRQRDRRQSLEHELTRLERRLERESRDPSEELKTLRARNRTLRRWVEWKRRSLYRRLLARALGERPPELERPSRRPPIADGVNDPVPADD
jgi:membrane protein